MTNTHSKKKNINLAEEAAATKAEGKYQNFKDWLDIKGIANFPIRVTHEPTQKRLADGTMKRKKSLEKFDMRIVTTNDFDDGELMKKRWDKYKNGNQYEYNTIAYDTRNVRVVDVDCILEPVDGAENPFITLLKTNPYKKSSTKSFGRHIFVNKGNVPATPKRTKQNFDKKYGIDHKGTEGVEYLNGLWGWSPMEDIIFNPDRPTCYNPKIVDFNIAISNKKKNQSNKKQKVLKLKKKYKIKDTKKNTRTYDLQVVKENLMNFTDEDIHQVQKWAGIIRACASSQDEDVYNIVHEVSKRANYDGEAWVRKAWDSFNPDIDDLYSFDKFCKKFVPISSLEVDEDAIGNYFLANYKHNFHCLTKVEKSNRKLCHFDEADNTWKTGHNICQPIIYTIVSNKIQPLYKERFENWKDNNDDDKELKNLEKGLRKFRTHTFLNKVTIWIINHMLTDADIKADIQFNLEDSTKHYVQFRNGAFNLKTGLLEPRTRKMYITEYLNYNYTPEKDEQKIAAISKLIEMAVPNKLNREGVLAWRGLCLTGNIEKAFMLFYGATGDNGKSKLSFMMKWAFPIYVKRVSQNLFDKNNSNFDKALSALANTPTRLVFAEEFGKKTLDVERFKSVIGSTIVSVCPLYHEQIEMKLQWQFEASTNNEMNASNDAALKLRGNVVEMRSKFVKNKLEVNPAKHIYLMDDTIETMFEDKANCLALFHLLAPYSKKYYEDGLELPDSFKKVFAESLESNDVWSEIFDEYFEVGGASDFISKNELTHFVKNLELLPDNVDWRTIKGELQKRGYKYERTKKKDYCKGCISGLKFKEVPVYTK